ncbi:hypothetical protein B0H19DRAFT_1275217 [Mycena capillaripes]|nr:hypothetical protein B0H19DRAFT_1275217 [Mycena capillaripes]
MRRASVPPTARDPAAILRINDAPLPRLPPPSSIAPATLPRFSRPSPSSHTRSAPHLGAWLSRISLVLRSIPAPPPLPLALQRAAPSLCFDHFSLYCPYYRFH